MNKFFLCLTSFILIVLLPLIPQETDNGSENLSKNKGVEYITDINLIATWPPQALAGVNQNFKIPLMRFDNPLMKNNNINFKIGAELSPISFEGKFGITWTPLAVLELYMESRIGSGWNISKDLKGLALNENKEGKSNYIPHNFTKAIYSFSLGGAFQFDLGAILSHDWSHFIFRTDQFFLYKAMSGVNSETSWVYQADSGTNRNGWQYGASYVIGYKMPIFLDMIALKIDTQKKLFTSPKGLNNEIWGENLLLTTIGPIINFNIKKNYNIMLLAQWYTYPVYKNEVNDDFYQTKVLDIDIKTQLRYYQVGVIFYMSIHR